MCEFYVGLRTNLTEIGRKHSSPLLRSIPTTCIKGVLAGHCINFFRKTAYEKLSMPENFSKCQS